MTKNLWLIFAVALGLGGCVNSNEVTPAQMATMDAADRAVSTALFDAEVDASTSYNVRKDGFVVIYFAKEVPSGVYNRVVARLRSDDRITGVRAEQGGREVCILSRSRSGE
jgi:hypothetical protein